MLPVVPDPAHIFGSEMRVQASAVHDNEFETQTRPLLIEVHGADSRRATWVLKRRSKLGSVQSCIELVAARLATRLGIRVPTYGVIDVQQDLVDLLPAKSRARLQSEIGENFGTLFLEGYVDLYSADQVQRTHLPDAPCIYTFDVACDNADRTDTPRGGAVRSNLIYGREGLVAIDHQQTFSWYFLLGQPAPRWTQSIRTSVEAEHFLRSVIHGVPTESLVAMRERLASIQEREIEQMTSELPVSWLNDGGERCVASIREYLLDVKSKADEVFFLCQPERSNG